MCVIEQGQIIIEDLQDPLPDRILFENIHVDDTEPIWVSLSENPKIVKRKGVRENDVRLQKESHVVADVGQNKKKRKKEKLLNLIAQPLLE